jgi:hypothetical protein
MRMQLAGRNEDRQASEEGCHGLASATCFCTAPVAATRVTALCSRGMWPAWAAALRRRGCNTSQLSTAALGHRGQEPAAQTRPSGPCADMAGMLLRPSAPIHGHRRCNSCRGREHRRGGPARAASPGRAGPGPSSSANGATGDGGLPEKLARVRRRLGMPTSPAAASSTVTSDSGGNGPSGSASNGNPTTSYENGWGGANGQVENWYEDWDPSTRYTPPQVERMAEDGTKQFRKMTERSGPRDKWITPVRL